MEPTVISLPWIEIAKIVLSAGVVTAVINQGVGLFKDWRKDQISRKRDGSYSALRIAVIFEKFAVNCANRISSTNLYIDSSANAGELFSIIPNLDEYPNDLNWKSLDSQLAAQVLSFANEIPMFQSAIDTIQDVDPCFDSVTDEFKRQTGKCGYRGWLIATSLRNKYRIQPAEFPWAVGARLKKIHDDAGKI